jgi:hypothetical protein
VLQIGHVAAALDDERMLVFGGRGVGGRILNDTWVYDYTLDLWQLVQSNEALQLPVPNARYFSSCCSVRIPAPRKARATSNVHCKLKESDRDVYLFGGTTYSFCGWHCIAYFCSLFLLVN